MSIVEELGAQVRSAADELPVGLLMTALDHLRQASDRLRWVRQESADPMGVPELSAALEHAESAGHTLRVAQDQLATYLAAIGLTGDGAAARRAEPDRIVDEPPVDPTAPEPEPTEAPTVRRWWSVRVAELTGGRDTPSDKPDGRVTDPEELLRRVATNVRSGDRGRLHAELRGVDANVGLDLAAVAPPVLRELATRMLGHPPRADDLPQLRRAVDNRVRDLLPGLPPGVLETLLTRLCRMPPPRREDNGRNPPEQPHPADPAVAAGVLTGLLLDRVGGDARTVITTSREPHA
ncbi:hypothetical protein AB0J86_07805 [Micromonospora sp. NPDC049559]|uniref:hypothetical protein n=1 Tax=Micromonospora sp. NPDC049559 TaxID=3155923 RepID=UPI0034395661